MKNKELERAIKELGTAAVERGVQAGISKDRLRVTCLGIDEIEKMTGSKPLTVRIWRSRGFVPSGKAIIMQKKSDGRYDAEKLSSIEDG